MVIPSTGVLSIPIRSGGFEKHSIENLKIGARIGADHFPICSVSGGNR